MLSKTHPTEENQDNNFSAKCEPKFGEHSQHTHSQHTHLLTRLTLRDISYMICYRLAPHKASDVQMPTIPLTHGLTVKLSKWWTTGSWQAAGGEEPQTQMMGEMLSCENTWR